MIKAWKEETEVGGDNVKKISNDIIEMEREKENKELRRGDKNSGLK